MNTEPQVDDISFDEAFEQALAAYDDPDYIPDDVGVDHDEDSSVTDVDTPQDDSKGDVEVDPVVEADPAQAPADPDVDYKALYERQQQEAAMHTNLLSSRLQSLAEQYRELKAQTQSTKTPETEGTEVQPEELPESFKEFLEYYPDTAKPLQEYVDNKVKAALQAAQQDAQKRLAPVETFMQDSHKSTHVNTIRAAHPDFDAIAASPDLIAWIRELPTVTRTGAVLVAQQGDASQVIDLINEYKLARGTASTTPATKTNKKSTEDKADKLVEKVKNAMSVPTRGRTVKDLNKQTSIPEDDFDAAFDAYAKEYDKQYYRRK